MSGPTVRVRDLRKRFRFAARPGRVALRDVDADAEAGVTVVAGANGAGKTTLLSVLLGFLHPTAGRATIDGTPPRRWIRRHGAGYVPERFDAPPGWTPAAALRDLARLAPGDGSADDVIERFGLGALAGRRLGTLSRGERQRFALAQAALGSPALLVLDEPEQGLDATGRSALIGWVRERRAEGATVLLSTHDLDLAADLADRAVVLAAGRMVASLVAETGEHRPAAYLITLAAPHAALSALVGESPSGHPAEGSAVDEDLPPIDEGVIAASDEDALAQALARLVDAGARPVRVEPAASRWRTRLAAALEQAVTADASGGAR